MTSSELGSIHSAVLDVVEGEEGVLHADHRNTHIGNEILAEVSVPSVPQLPDLRAHQWGFMSPTGHAPSPPVVPVLRATTLRRTSGWVRHHHAATKIHNARHSLRGSVSVINTVALHGSVDHTESNLSRPTGGTMLKSADEVLRDLIRGSNLSLRSDSKLVGAVDTAAAKDDENRVKKRAEKEAAGKVAKGGDATLRRKPELRPLSPNEGHSVRLTPWDVLHVLGQAIALDRRGAARGLAEHWGSLKYSQALTGDSGSFMELSAEGRTTAKYYKSIQSTELGYGFGLIAAHQILAQRFPDRVVSIVPADTTLSAGWSKLGTYRPQFFAEVWKPGKRSLVIPITCKGNHSKAAYSHGQLVSASTHVEAVHIGPWNETPALIFSTELPKDGNATVHALQAGGRGGWLNIPQNSGGLDAELHDLNYFPSIELPAEVNEPPASVDGFHITPERFEWFGQVIARTNAAALTAFAGDGDATAQYLTNRQGRKKFIGVTHAATGSVQDAHHTLCGIEFMGTDHVFRLNKTRVEAFTGVADDLLRLLIDGRVEEYRREIYTRRSTWPSKRWDKSWNGPVSIRPDGTVLAMRLLPLA